MSNAKKNAKHLYVHHQLESSVEKKAVVLVIHGLNLAPYKMDSLCSLLGNWGMESYRLSLQGHGENFGSFRERTERVGTDDTKTRLLAFKEVTGENWLTDLSQCWKDASVRASQLQVPLHLLGFSLGGLVGCAGQLRPDLGIRFEKMLLFAPALALRWHTSLLRPLQIFPKLVLRSGSPRPYRANWGTSMAAYASLGDLFQYTMEHADQRLNQPTLIFLDQRDELISLPKLSTFTDKHQLNQWQIEPIQQQAQMFFSPRHLIIDEVSVGSSCWSFLAEKMKQHLLG